MSDEATTAPATDTGEAPETPTSVTTPAPSGSPTETAEPTTDAPATTDAAATSSPASAEPAAVAPAAPAAPPTAAPPTAAPAQSSMATPSAPARGLTYAVDIVFCIDVTGSMTPIIDQVKTNALRFYDDVQQNLTAKGKNVDALRVRIVAFRDLKADGDAAIDESPFFTLPSEQGSFAEFINRLVAEGGGDDPESGLEAVALAIHSPWTTTGDRRRQVIVVWTDQPAQPLDAAGVPPTLRERIPADFSALTDVWENDQGPLGSSSKRLILFAPDGPGWSDISGVWENVVHHPSQAGGGLSDVDYGTIIDSIGNSV